MTPNSSPQFDTSFLPQQPLARTNGGMRRREPISISMIIALIIFFMMLFATGGVVLYKKNIERRIDAEKGELASKEREIDLNTIAEFDRLAQRLGTASKLLSEHSTFSLVLQILSEGTAVNVGYSKLSFADIEGFPTVTLSGVAPSYGAVYFQGEALRVREYIKSVEIRNVVLDVRSGTVSFEMVVGLFPDGLRYGRYFETPTSSASSVLITNPNSSTTPASGGVGDGNAKTAS